MAKDIRSLSRYNESAGQTEIFYPATITDAIAHPTKRKSLTDVISDIETSIDTYDVSAKNPTAGPNSDGKWESLSALLSDANLDTLIPADYRKGGMSIKFVQSSDNNYVQYRSIADEFTTDITKWRENDSDDIGLVASKFTNKNKTIFNASVGSEPNIVTNNGFNYEKIAVVGGDEIRICIQTGSDTRLPWVTVGSDNKIARTAASRTVDEVVTIEDGEQYILIQGNTESYPDGYFTIRTIDNRKICTSNLREIEAIKQKEYIQEKSILNSATKINNKFLQYYNSVLSVVTTSANNVIYKVNIDGFNYIRFNASSKAGGSGTVASNKVAYAVTDGQGTVLLSSEVGSSFSINDYKVNLPKNAVILYVSYNGDTDVTNRYIVGGEYLLGEDDITSSIQWDAQTSFLVYQNRQLTKVSTSATNYIGKVDVSNYNIVSFGTSLTAGGQTTNKKLIYCFVDKDNNIIQSSKFYPSNTYTDSTFELNVPSSAKYLYLSWDGSSTNKFITGYFNVKSDNDSESIKSDIENSIISGYMTTHYDNSDYNYSNAPNYKIGSDDYDKPNSISISIPIKTDTDVSRGIAIADNPAFNNERIINLNLASKEYSLTNLIGNKRYYYQVVSDTQVISGGVIFTKGSVRFLYLQASSEFDKEYIPNVRDIGGKKIKGSSIIRYGSIIRGSELFNDEQVNISAAGIAELKALGINAELDLRPDYTEGVLDYYAATPVDLWFFRLNIYHTISSQVTAFANAIRQILKWVKEGIGVYIHCQGGCDRTGALCAIIEGLCGVCENDINKDYEMSVRYRYREYYNIYNGVQGRDDYDGDFRYAMEYIKGLKLYNGVIYTKCTSYKDSMITIGNVSYVRNGTQVNNDIKYCKWINGTDIYYTRDVYPTENSQLYNSDFTESAEVISDYQYQYYYNTASEVTNYTPVPIVDTAIINALEALPLPTLKEQFRLLMQVGGVGLTIAEMDEIERLIVS